MQKAYGQAAAGLFGYSHLYGGYPGGQAQYVRVPCADFGAFKVPESLSDEQVLFLTGYFPDWLHGSRELPDRALTDRRGLGLRPGRAVRHSQRFPARRRPRNCSPDNVPERLELARKGGAETLNDEDKDVQEKLRAMTSGRGPDHCIDAVGMEAHGATLDAVYDRIKTAVMLETGLPLSRVGGRDLRLR